MAAAARTRKDAMQHHHLLISSLLAALCVASGCASVGPPPVETGPREGFEAASLRSVAVVPFFSADPFGLEPEARAHMLATYESAAVADLTSLGLEVVAPDQVREALTAAERLHELETRLDLDRSIDTLFETGPFAKREEGVVDDRRVFLQELGALLKVDAVLLGEVVYHTDARCDASSSSTYTPYVVIEGSGRPQGETVPCAVSHFQAKLIDPREAKPLWFNRALREVRATAPEASTPDLDQNARRTVELVLLETNKGLKGVFERR